VAQLVAPLVSIHVVGLPDPYRFPYEVYEVLKKEDPTAVYIRKLVSILTRLKEENKITEGQYKMLYPTTENTLQMYCTVHPRSTKKVRRCVRLSITQDQSATIPPGHWQIYWHHYIVGKTDHHVKNSHEFATEMASVSIDEGECFVSHDVVSLFTNTPISEALEIICNQLENDKSVKDRTNLEIDDIMELLEFVVTTTYFTFRGVIYQQRFGTAIGKPVSPIIANFFMEWLEQRAMTTAPLNCRPRLWNRFVDDTLEVIKRGSVTQLTEHLNSVDSTGSIRFTYEEETVLDTLLIRKEDGNIKLLVYRKKTYTDQYLNFMSYHPLYHKLVVIRTLLNRCENVVTEEEDWRQEEEHITSALKKCSYPTSSIRKAKKGHAEQG